MKILGIDMGEKRIGLAVSDPLGITAQGLKTIQLDNPEEIYDKILNIVKEKNIQLIVFGLPRNMNGTLGPKAQKVQEQAKIIQEKSNLPIDFEDERLSTVSAQQVLLMADQSRAKRKKAVDRLSAVIILQSYLDRKNYLKKER
ncbi:MAG: Holliday junction resolvase RuvX [Atribacterota bacterium]|nr:Holliday junction resolvase RuvX [Atribacterota bacterium]